MVLDHIKKNGVNQEQIGGEKPANTGADLL
jgi:hypothetical protein